MVYFVGANICREKLYKMSHTKISPQVASKDEEPVVASKEEEPIARNAIADHRARVIEHLVGGNTQAAFQALMTDHNGRQLDYAESRELYG